MTPVKTQFLEDVSKYIGLTIILKEDGEVIKGTISKIEIRDNHETPNDFIEFYIEGSDGVFCGISKEYFSPYQDGNGAIYFDIIYIGSVKIY